MREGGVGLFLCVFESLFPPKKPISLQLMEARHLMVRL